MWLTSVLLEKEIMIRILYTYTYCVRWIKDIENDQICLNKQQIKDTVAYFLVNWLLTVSPRYFVKLEIFT